MSDVAAAEQALADAVANATAEERGWGEVERAPEGGIARLTFTVPGKPLTWQRARKGKHGPMFTPEDRLNHMDAVRNAWKSLGVPPFDSKVYLALGVVVFCQRQQGHYRTSGELKEWALRARPGAGTYGGDIDNFGKLVKDALNLVAYHDDTQIVEYLTPWGKWHVGDPVMDPEHGMPRTIVTIQPVAPVDLALVDGQEVLIGG